MFSGLFDNKNKIPRYEYTKEQPRTKKNFAPVICVSAYLSVSKKNHSLRASPQALIVSTKEDITTSSKMVLSRALFSCFEFCADLLRTFCTMPDYI
jgi:hypothetical protein